MDDDVIVIILDDEPRAAEKGFRVACIAERFNASTLAGLRAARRRINQLIDERFPDTVDEE